MSYCNWGNASDVTQHYHDEEWGMPVRKRRNRERGVVNSGK